jgi:hypothetical protein
MLVKKLGAKKIKIQFNITINDVPSVLIKSFSAEYDKIRKYFSLYAAKNPIMLHKMLIIDKAMKMFLDIFLVKVNRLTQDEIIK